MVVNCFVAAISKRGTPYLWPVVVECTMEQYTTQVYYGAANTAAADNGFGPKLAFNASSEGLERHFDWEKAHRVNISGENTDKQ